MKKLNWILIIVLLGFILLAGVFFIFTTTLSQPEAMKMIHSAHSGSEDSIPETNVLHILILSDSTVYGYTNDLNKGQNLSLYPANQLRSFIRETKKEWKDSITVLIKPTSSSTYKSTVDVLDEMTINEIQKFAMFDPSAEEKIKLGVIQGPDVSGPIYPVSVTQTFEEKPNSLIIVLRNKGTIKLYFINQQLKRETIPVADTSTRNISAAIEMAKKIAGKDSLRITIQSDPELKYPDFKNVMEALRRHEIYKYQLITTTE